jgi:hypothetical protein
MLLGTCKTRLHILLNHAPLELSKNSHHAEQRLTNWRGGVGCLAGAGADQRPSSAVPEAAQRGREESARDDPLTTSQPMRLPASCSSVSWFSVLCMSVLTRASRATHWGLVILGIGCFVVEDAGHELKSYGNQVVYVCHFR